MHGVFTLWYSRSVSGDIELLSLLQFASGHCSVRDSRSPLAALIFKCRFCAQACGQRALASGRAFCLAPTFCSAQLSQNHHYCSLAKSFTCERERASTGIMQQQQDQSEVGGEKRSEAETPTGNPSPAPTHPHRTQKCSQRFQIEHFSIRDLVSPIIFSWCLTRSSNWVFVNLELRLDTCLEIYGSTIGVRN